MYSAFISKIHLKMVNLYKDAAKLQSTQYKKLAPNALRFAHQNLKSCKPHEKTEQKHQNARSIDEKLKTKSLMFFVSFFFSCHFQDFKF